MMLLGCVLFGIALIVVGVILALAVWSVPWYAFVVPLVLVILGILFLLASGEFI